MKSFWILELPESLREPFQAFLLKNGLEVSAVEGLEEVSRILRGRGGDVFMVKESRERPNASPNDDAGTTPVRPAGDERFALHEVDDLWFSIFQRLRPT